MSKKSDKVIYWGATALITALMLMSAGMYFFDNATVQEAYITLGFPTFIIYPLAVAKILGILAIWTKKSKTLKEWAYAGFFFNLVLAVAAHFNINDGQYVGALIGLVLLLISYAYDRKLYS